MLTFEQALEKLLAAATPVEEIRMQPLTAVAGRVLAVAQQSSVAVPPLDNSGMDGYAVRCADVAAAGVELPVSQRIAAGSAGEPLQPGTAARIFTGAPVPAGADAILMQEDCEAQGDGRVRINAVPQPGQWIRRAGEDITRGAVVLPAGTRLTPAELGLAASIGLHQLQVARRPRVALFSTGDELVMPGDVPPEQMRPGAIYNSNRFFLRAMLQRLGCEVTDFGIVPDRRDATIEALRAASSAHDLILTSGGVSVGEEDHVKPAVQAEGQLDLWLVAMKPGKPVAFGRVNDPAGGNGADFIGLPGNPVSSFVTFLMLVRPFILRRMGVEDCLPHSIRLPAGFDWPRPDRRREFLRARVGEAGQVELFPNQGPGVLSSTVWAAGLVDNPAGHAIAQGEPVSFIPYSELLS